MADTLTLKEVELDYEAEEVEEAAGTPTPGGVASSPRQGEDEDDDGEIPSSPARQTDEICSDPGEAEDGEEQGDADEGELEEGEELEDGEISDEDEALKTERLEPKPVCRFFSKGQCTWGQSCRFPFGNLPTELFRRSLFEHTHFQVSPSWCSGQGKLLHVCCSKANSAWGA